MRILSRTPRSHSWLKATKVSHQERAQFFVSCKCNCALQSFFRSSVEFIQYLQLVIFIFSLEQPTHRLITSCACPPANLCVVFSNYLMIWHGYTSIGTICHLSLLNAGLHKMKIQLLNSTTTLYRDNTVPPSSSTPLFSSSSMSKFLPLASL